MGILARIDNETRGRSVAQREFRDSLENPNVPLSAFGDMFMGGWWHSAAGVVITPDVVLGIPAAWCAINFIAGTIAALPLFVYRDGAKGPECTTNDPLYWLLHDQVNDDKLTSFAWRKQLMVNVLLHGRSITFIERTAAGRVMNLWPLVGGEVKVERVNGRRQYTYRENGKTSRYGSDEVIDIPFLLRPDGVRHYEPVTLFSDAFGLTVALERYASKFFQNGGVPPLAMQMPPGASNGAAKRGSLNIEELIKQAHEEARLVLPMPEGHTLTPIGFNPGDGQLIEARKLQILECARIWDIPPAFLQDLTGATYANAEQQDLILVKHTLTQWLKSIEQELNAKLLGPRTKCNIEFSLDGLLRGDFASRMAAYASGIQNGNLMPDEVRALENRPQMGGPAAKLYIQGATVPLGSNAPPKPPKSGRAPPAPPAPAPAPEPAPPKPAKRFNDNHTPAGPGGGQFTSGGGGGGATAGGGVKAKAAKTIADVKAFLDGKSAGEVVAAVATSHAMKESVSFALQSLVSHGTVALNHLGLPVDAIQGLDASTWHLNEELIGHTISHLADTAAITALQAKDVLGRAVSGLIKMRENQLAGKAKRDAGDGEDGADQDLALAFLKALAEALDNYEPPQEPASSGA